MNWKTGTVFEGPGRSERFLGAGRALRVVGSAALVLLACSVMAQSPARVDPPQKAIPQKTTISSDVAPNGCVDCAKTAAANLDAMAAPGTQLAIAEQDAQILHLAAQLKVEVDRCAPDTLQVDVVRKANLIRRLANELKKEVKLTLRAK